VNTASTRSVVIELAPGLDVTVREAGHGTPVFVLHGAAGPDSVGGLVTDLAGHHRVLPPLWGENDPVVRPAFGRAYATAFPNARFVVIPGGGHLPWREAPEQTYATLSAFLDEGNGHLP
jgi:pimeloyl-ACP methyl ester carboxylesterase